MHLDVQDLRNFYYRSTLGRAVQRTIRDQVLALWPEAKGQTVCGFGFAAPLMRPFLADARRVIALMPAPQGVMPWPSGMPNVSVLSEDTQWPLETGHVDRLILLHGLETSETPSSLLDEAYRVLGPGGRMLIIVPHRSGLWARSDKTPFGYGRPYSLAQLENQLKTHHFRPERHRSTLYQPPSSKRFWRKSSRAWESFGQMISPVMSGGVLIVEASKRVPAPTGTAVRDIVRKPLEVLAPKPEPVANSRTTDREG